MKLKFHFYRKNATLYAMKFTKILLYAVLFFLQAYLIRFKILGYPTNLQEILIAITGATFLVEIIRAKLFVQTLKNIGKHWVIVSFVFLTGIALARLPIGSTLDLIRHFKFLTFALVTAFIFLETFRTNNERKNAIKIAGFGAIAFGIFSVIYNLLGYNVAPDLRLLGPLDAAVYLAYYLTPFFIFFTIEFIKKPLIKFSNINFICAIILAILIIATQSMGSIVAGFLVIAIYLFKNHSIEILNKKITKIILTIFAVAILGSVFYTKILPTIQTPWSSLHERGEIWQTSVALLKDPENVLFGLGLGQFQYYYENSVDAVIGQKPLDYIVLQPHNIFLLFIFQYGILGLAFIIFCMYFAIKFLIQTKKIPEISKTTLYILLYFFIHGLIDTPFFKNDLLILLILFMELGLVYFKPSTKSNKAA